MQLGFLWKELSEGYTSLLEALKTATSVRAASDMVLTQFERPADQSEAVKAKRAAYGQTIYNKYASKGGTTMTEQELRQKIVSIAQSYLGCRAPTGKLLTCTTPTNRWPVATPSLTPTHGAAPSPAPWQ